ncbi:MAG: hypothetical protein DJ555_07060 [Desulfurococcaceae archaeon]|jgi:hypothetical protein|nr:MAG: hypothetical protein DJ555_07060 [Desulfurococcaceae archaeon]
MQYLGFEYLEHFFSQSGTKIDMPRHIYADNEFLMLKKMWLAGSERPSSWGVGVWLDDRI